MALALGLCALVLYYSTLLPGVGGPEDTPKFQYIGHVLGTAHAPGYPLYILIAHAFSWLPLGTPAWRANLLSGVFGAVTVAALYVVCRLLGASRTGALAVALGAAVGRYFWWNAVLAEVYTLGAALLALALERLVRWSITTRPRHFFGAVAWCALALGNHLSIVAVVPAFVLFSLAVNWRFALRPTTLATVLAWVGAGLTPYAFIAVRTFQQAPFLESRIASFRDFWFTLRGGPFDSLMFAFDLSTLVRVRIPAAGALLLDEFTVMGASLIVLGLGVGLRRAPARALLLAGGAAAAVLLAVNFDSDQKGFLVPAFVMAWPLMAFLLRPPAAGGRRLPYAAALVAAVTVPIAAFARNLPVNDMSGQRYFADYFESLAATVPPRSAFLFEDYVVDSMLEYQYATGPTIRRVTNGVRRTPAAIDALHGGGTRVFAFRSGAEEAASLGYPTEPLTLPGAPLADRLAQPGDDVVVVAGVWPGLAEALGLGAQGRATWSQRAHTVVGARAGAAPLVVVDTVPVTLSLARLAPTLADVTVETTSDGGAVIRRDGSAIAGVHSGAVAAEFRPDGTLQTWHGVAGGRPLRWPLSTARLPIYEVRPRVPCDAVGDGAWTDVSAMADRGSVRLTTNGFRAGEASFLLYLSTPEAVRPTISGQHGGAPAALRHDLYGPAAGAELRRRIEMDGLPAQMLPESAVVHRIEVTVDDGGDWATLLLGLGASRGTLMARGRTDRREDWRMLICHAPLPVLDAEPRSVVDLWLGAGAEPAFGAGWRPAEPGTDGPTRWMAEPSATVRVWVNRPRATALELDVLPRTGDAALRLSVNGAPLERQALTGGWQLVRWRVAANHWRPGMNVVELETAIAPTPCSDDADRRRRTVAIRRWRAHHGATQ